MEDVGKQVAIPEDRRPGRSGVVDDDRFCRAHNRHNQFFTPLSVALRPTRIHSPLLQAAGDSGQHFSTSTGSDLERT